MPRKRKSDGEDFKFLKELGFEFKTPQDEFSYQPGSGGLADGIIGKQEYGIDIDLDAETREAEDLDEENEKEDPLLPIPGESSWSQEHRLSENPPKK